MQLKRNSISQLSNDIVSSGKSTVKNLYGKNISHMNDSLNESIESRIRQARAKFAAMAATYFAGVLNDNFFKQSALLIAVTADKSHLQGWATIVFTLPFILFAAPAGFCADRFSKRSIVIASKFLELIAMIFAAIGIYLLNWQLIIVTLFIMGLQSTLFGPSLRGTIPELYPPEYVVTANAVIRMISTGAILAGIALAGIILDVKGFIGKVQLAYVIASCVVVGIAAIGLIVSFGVPKFPAASTKVKFPWAGPLNSIKILYDIKEDSLLTIAITAKAFFWFVGSLNVLVINQLGLEQFGLTNTLTSALFIVELAGIAIGSLLSTKLAKGKNWFRVLWPSAGIIAVCMFTVAIVPQLPASIRKATIISALGLLGVAGGIFSIPLASFVQVRPSADIKGRIIAASSFADFTAILFSGNVFYFLNHWNIKPSNCFAVKGVMTAAIAAWLFIALRGKMESND